MREKRYSCEHQIKDAQQIVEILHKEIQIQTKQLKIIEGNLKKNKDELNMFMVLFTFIHIYIFFSIRKNNIIYTITSCNRNNAVVAINFCSNSSRNKKN